MSPLRRAASFRRSFSIPFTLASCLFGAGLALTFATSTSNADVAVRAARRPPTRHALSLHLNNQWVLDDGIRVSGSSSDLLQAELRYGAQVFERDRLGVWLEGDYGVGKRDAFSNPFNRNLLIQQLHLSTRAVIAVRPWLLPQVRLGVGAVIGRAQVGVPGASGESWAGGFSGFLTAGLELLIPRPFMRSPTTRGVTAGLLIEGGYLVASPMSFSTEPASSGENLRIASSNASLGDLDLSGPLFRIGATLRF